MKTLSNKFKTRYNSYTKRHELYIITEKMDGFGKIYKEKTLFEDYSSKELLIKDIEKQKTMALNCGYININ